MRISSGRRRSTRRPARSRPWRHPSADVPSSTGRFCRRQREAGRTVRALQRRLPRVRGLVGVAGAHHREAGDRAQRREVLDRLVSRAVLAEADGVVRPDVDDAGLHQRGQPDRAAHVVAEDQERAAVGAGRPVQRDAVEDRAHGVLADAEVQRAAVGLRPSTPSWRSTVGPNESAPSIVVLLLSARSAEPPHSSGSTSASASSTSPDALRVATPLGSGVPARQRLRPSRRAACGRAAGPAAPCAPGSRAAHVVERRRSTPRAPRCRGRTTSRACASTSSSTWNVCSGSKPRMRLDRGDLLVAQRGAVRLAGVHLGRRGEADDRAQHDDRRPARSPPSPPRARRGCR